MRMLLLYIFLLSLISCVDPIDFPVGNQESLLIVEGLITNRLDLYNVNLSRSAAYENVLSGGLEVAETGATVSLLALSNQQEHFFLEQRPGNYVSLGDFVGIEGEEYQLKIILTDGSLYYSNPQKLLANSTFDEIENSRGTIQELNEFKNVITKQGMNINVGFTFEKNDPDYIHWRYSYSSKSQSNEKQFDDSDNIIIMESSDFSRNQIKDYNLLFIEKFGNNNEVRTYKLEVLQYSVNLETYKFWEMAANQQGSSISIFDPVVNQINGNIYNANNPDEAVLGIFSAVGVNTKEIEFSM